jgi:predicted PurR-regulated permease PerM
VNWGKGLFYAAVVLTVVWLAWAGRGIWFPVAIAFVLAMVLDPTVDRLENRGCSRPLATTLVFLFFIAGSVLATIVLSPGISDQAGAMARDLGRLFPDPDHPDLVVQRMLAKLNAHPVLRNALRDAAREGTQRLSQTLLSASDLALAWAPNLVWFLIVPVLAFYTLNDFHRIYAKAILLVPPQHRPLAQTLIAEISAVFGKYLRGLATVCFLLAICSALLLYAFHNPYWQLLGLMAGLLYAVPVAGPLFTFCLVVLVTMVTATPGQALLVGGLLLLLTNGIFDQVVTPRVVGRHVGLHPILTILALLLGYQVWGITGMLIAVPLAASVQTVVLHLVPKLRTDLQLRPLEELKRTEEETRAEHLAAEDKPLDQHIHLHTVVENAETDTSPETPPEALLEEDLRYAV